jgi:biopolymer transport protein ExbD
MPEMKEAGVNVTPLIDVVMVLIVFFMLVAKIGVSTGAEQMDIPESIQGVDIKDMGNTLLLNVRATRAGTGDMPYVTALLRSKDTGEPIAQELKIVDPTTNKRQLLDTLKWFRAGASSGVPNPEFKVIIRGEADMGYRFLEPVLITCAEADVKNVNFNTKKVEKTVSAPADAG